MGCRGRIGMRALFYVGGLAIMAFGVVLSVRSDLGVTPISSIPYTMTVVSGMDLGVATMAFSVLMVALQVVILRGRYKPVDLLQLPVGILFGALLAACGRLLDGVPAPGGLAAKLVVMVASTVLVALGVFLYVSAGFVPLAPEGFMIAVSKAAKKEFSTIKVLSDVSMVVVSLVACLVMTRSLGSVGVDTIAAAVLVGSGVRLLERWCGERRDGILGMDAEG